MTTTTPESYTSPKPHWSLLSLTAVVLIASATHAQAPASPTPPLIRGALWWVTEPYYWWYREQLAETLDAQPAGGVDLRWWMNAPCG